MALKVSLIAIALLIAAGLAFYLITTPVTFSASDMPDHVPDAANGKTMFIAGGCAECHAVPAKACDSLDIEDETRLAGGRCLKTDVGTFYVPNISPDKESGIGGWSTLDFVNAMKRGVAPGGVHLYPAFPYTSYQRMRFEDVIDLKALSRHTTAGGQRGARERSALPLQYPPRRGPVSAALCGRKDVLA